MIVHADDVPCVGPERHGPSDIFELKIDALRVIANALGNDNKLHVIRLDRDCNLSDFPELARGLSDDRHWDFRAHKCRKFERKNIGEKKMVLVHDKADRMRAETGRGRGLLGLLSQEAAQAARRRARRLLAQEVAQAASRRARRLLAQEAAQAGRCRAAAFHEGAAAEPATQSVPEHKRNWLRALVVLLLIGTLSMLVVCCNLHCNLRSESLAPTGSEPGEDPEEDPEEDPPARPPFLRVLQEGHFLPWNFP